MLPRSLSRYFLVFAVLALAAALAFAACGDDDDGGTDVSGVPELEDGVLTVGSDIAYAPFEFFQEGTEIEDGLDIDLAIAIAEELGVEIEFLNTGFDGIIPALQTEDFDILVSAMTITDERSEVIDFVPYITVGTGIVVPTGNPNDIQTLDDLCGLSVAVQTGTIQVDMLEAQNDTCDDPIDIVVFENNPLAVEDLRTGGADANFSDFPVAGEDAAQSEGDLEVVETQIAPEPYGIGVRMESTELKAAIADAIGAIMDSGKYDEILEKWGLEAVALQ